jgi:hypothetical protein
VRVCSRLVTYDKKHTVVSSLTLKHGVALTKVLELDTNARCPPLARG